MMEFAGTPVDWVHVLPKPTENTTGCPASPGDHTNRLPSAVKNRVGKLLGR